MTSTFLALLLATATSASGAYVVDPGASVVRFHLHHKMHEVDGRSSKIEGKAVLGDDGKVMTMVRIPSASFDTGDGNRDSHMRETLEAAKFPVRGVQGRHEPHGPGRAREAARGEARRESSSSTA